MPEIDERLPRAASAAAPVAPSAPEPAPRRTLAMRLAERNGQRELRAARLARLRTAGEGGAGRPDPVLEIYLPAAEEGHAPAPTPVPPAPDELARLPGVGPGLAAALRRAGLDRLADVAALEPAALAARLGPIGRLLPAARWVAAARAAAAPVSLP